MKFMKVEHIREREAFLRAGSVWNEFLFNSPQNCIFLTHEWFSSWWDSFSGDNSLEILIFRQENSEIAGIAPLMKKGEELSFMASSEVTDYCDFITGEDNTEDLFYSFLEYIGENYDERVRIELIGIRDSSPALIFLPRLASSFGFSFSSSEIEVTAFLNLPSTYEEYLSVLRRKSRHELRRKVRKTERLKRLKRLTVNKTKEIETYIDEFINLHRKSSPEKALFWKTEGMHEFFLILTQRLSPRGWVELELLLLDEKILACLLNFNYFNKLYFYNSAFDKEYAALSPGFYLFHSCIREAVEKERDVVDFLRGRERYKYDFGAQEGKIWKILLRPEKKRG